MRRLSENQRLTIVGAMCSLVVITAGIVALTGSTGVLVASVLLTASVVLAILGVAHARDHQLGWGLTALVAAALPLLFLLYGIGAWILGRFGPGIAGGLLIAIGTGIGLGTAAFSARTRRRAVR